MLKFLMLNPKVFFCNFLWSLLKVCSLLKTKLATLVGNNFFFYSDVVTELYSVCWIRWYFLQFPIRKKYISYPSTFHSIKCTKNNLNSSLFSCHLAFKNKDQLSRCKSIVPTRNSDDLQVTFQRLCHSRKVQLCMQFLNILMN